MAGSCSALAQSSQQTLDSVTFCYGSAWQFTALESKGGAEGYSGPGFKLSRLKKMLGVQKEWSIGTELSGFEQEEVTGTGDCAVCVCVLRFELSSFWGKDNIFINFSPSGI